MSRALHVDELLAEFVLGTLEPPERAAVATHLVGCPRCERERDAVAELLSDVALAEEPIAPPAELRARMLAATERVHRFADFVDRVAEFLDIAVDKARAYLAALDDPSVWQPLPFAGYSVFAPEVGPRLAGAQVGFLRIEPGARFPYHRHGGDEEVLLLQGGMIDDQSGREWHPGELWPMPKGSAHSYVGAPGPVCLCLGRVLDGKFEIVAPPA